MSGWGRVLSSRFLDFAENGVNGRKDIAPAFFVRDEVF